MQRICEADNSNVIVDPYSDLNKIFYANVIGVGFQQILNFRVNRT